MAANPHHPEDGTRPAALGASSDTGARRRQQRTDAAQPVGADHYEAKGNPISSRPITSVANCCPGLEVDFRAVWRRMFKGIELREYDNLVVHADQTGDAAGIFSVDRKLQVADLAGHRLLRVVVPDANGNGEIALPMMTPIKGPASSDPDGKIDLTTNMNPFGLAPMEWSNALARVVPHAGKKVRCDSAGRLWEQQQPLFNTDIVTADQQLSEDMSWEQKLPSRNESKNYVSFHLEVSPFFEDNTAVISDALAAAGELTQGLCSPWQNDYRECSCYYWASARPDFVNVDDDDSGIEHRRQLDAARAHRRLCRRRLCRQSPDDVR